VSRLYEISPGNRALHCLPFILAVLTSAQLRISSGAQCHMIRHRSHHGFASRAEINTRRQVSVHRLMGTGKCVCPKIRRAWTG
jgi:hypothetical protein